jgi:hypothetical protein
MSIHTTPRRGGGRSHLPPPPLTSDIGSKENLFRAETGNAATRDKLPAIPSTFELARACYGLWSQINEQDEIRTHAKAGSQEYADADAAYSRLYHQAFALNDLIFVSPITSIEDALAVAVHGFSRAEGADCREDNEVMKRAFSRLAIFLAATVQGDLGGLGSTNTNEMIRRSADLMVGDAA